VRFCTYDASEVEKTPQFARLLLKDGKDFVEDFYKTYYLSNFIPLLSYFRSPHITILYNEQHLDRQLKAAGEKLEEDPDDPFRLLVKSSLSGTLEWVDASKIPFNHVYIPDHFQRLVRGAANSQHFISSAHQEDNRLFYLPGKGLCYHNPTSLPEEFDNLTPFSKEPDKSNTYTPAVSFGSENATIKGTHAFAKLTRKGNGYYIGKFSYFRFTYKSVKTYWLIIKNVLPTLLKNQPSITLSPDQNLGYNDRTIVYLEQPISLTDEQIREIYSLLLSHHQQDEGNGFKIATKNCTILPEEILRVAGINLPCRAPLHTILKPTNPLLSQAIKLITDYPLLANPILISFGALFGARGEDRITTKTLEKIMSPYVLKIYINLKNSSEMIDKLKNNR
jgi:hypothetical protein